MEHHTVVKKKRQCSMGNKEEAVSWDSQPGRMHTEVRTRSAITYLFPASPCLSSYHLLQEAFSDFHSCTRLPIRSSIFHVPPSLITECAPWEDKDLLGLCHDIPTQTQPPLLAMVAPFSTSNKYSSSEPVGEDRSCEAHLLAHACPSAASSVSRADPR